MAIVASAGLVTAGGALAAIGAQAQAATAGCSVSYTVSSQWPGGFGANVTITNLGSSLSSWTLTWSFGAGQSITQLWNGTYTQSGSNVSVTNVSYNGSIPSGGNTSFGFNGSWNGSNPVPSSFSLNGVACTGGVTTSPSSSPSNSPSSSPSSSPSASPSSSPTQPAGQGPCDIFAAGGTPCVAAHSTTRALYAAYNGPLYQVRRSSDNSTRDIGVVSAGGVANAAAQDSFCS
ncbi:cellulose binding domain-containing protein, partial [Actinocrinis puniceicyclus]